MNKVEWQPDKALQGDLFQVIYFWVSYQHNRWECESNIFVLIMLSIDQFHVVDNMMPNLSSTAHIFLPSMNPLLYTQSCVILINLIIANRYITLLPGKIALTSTYVKYKKKKKKNYLPIHFGENFHLPMYIINYNYPNSHKKVTYTPQKKKYATKRHFYSSWIFYFLFSYYYPVYKHDITYITPYNYP